MVQSSDQQPRAESDNLTMELEEHESMEALDMDAVGRAPESESNSRTCCSSSSSTESTMLDHLRVPTPSTLARKRKIGVNSAPPKGKKQASGQALKAPYMPKGITPSHRASEFPGEQLVVSAGKLFCRACKKTLCLKRSVVLNHIKSSKHEDGKQKLTINKARERDLAKALEKHDAKTHRKGETARGPESLQGQSCACIHGSRDCTVKARLPSFEGATGSLLFFS